MNFGAKDLETFVAVGQALAEVRDHRLYLGVARTFDDYCLSRFGITAERANPLIEVAQQYAARGQS